MPNNPLELERECIEQRQALVEIYNDVIIGKLYKEVYQKEISKRIQKKRKKALKELSE